GHIGEGDSRARLQHLTELGHELDVGLGLPALLEHADRVLAVGVDHRWLALRDLAEGAQYRGELGDVVGVEAAVLTQLDAPPRIDDDDAEPGRARVARARAVAIDDDRAVRRLRRARG